jgi:hypothetical protein
MPSKKFILAKIDGRIAQFQADIELLRKFRRRYE